MKTQTKRTILLSSDEVKEAVQEYINLHSGGAMSVGDGLSVFVVFDNQARHAGVEIEAVVFE